MSNKCCYPYCSDKDYFKHVITLILTIFMMYKLTL